MTIHEKTDKADRAMRSAQVKVWDIAVRLFHWSLVIAFAFAWISAEEWDKAHEWIGYFIGGLLVFRIVWGFVGPKYARFNNFLYTPSTVQDYLHNCLNRKSKRYLGHNPLGGAMVMALILSLLTACATGYAITSNAFLGLEWMEELHEISAKMTLILIALHVAGVVFASFEHGENLIKSMVVGYKRFH